MTPSEAAGALTLYWGREVPQDVARDALTTLSTMFYVYGFESRHGEHWRDSGNESMCYGEIKELLAARGPNHSPARMIRRVTTCWEVIEEVAE